MGTEHRRPEVEVLAMLATRRMVLAEVEVLEPSTCIAPWAPCTGGR